MNGDVETEAPRPRPLSGGLWTLFSWLRRDERSSSSDSLSSAGSDRTVASFAYLAPTHYRSANPPLVLPPPGPPTDSYKKRVQDRNIRRHHDRDLTLHRKYGLYRSEGGNGYDAFSLPPVRRVSGEGSRWDRDRRATSECLPQHERAVHVPGKRRAPPPPCSVGPATTLPRRSRKRPAPQPPINYIDKTKENIKDLEQTTNISIQMNHQPVPDKQPLPNNDHSTGRKSEKYTKRDANVKETKNRSDKSFLKQIFENRKRNSAIEISSVKLLPSISELDKQAAAIIESCKQKALEQNNNMPNMDGININAHDASNRSSKDMWYCTRCLKKYNASVIACVYCTPNERSNKKTIASNASNDYTQTENVGLPKRITGPDERQKLREMLKEMKDSLPKRPKHDSVETKVTNKNIETPTLRIGSSVPQSVSERKLKLPQPSSSKIPSSELLNNEDKTQSTKPMPLTQTVLVTQPIASTHQVNSDMNVTLATQSKTNNGNVHKIALRPDTTENKSNLQISTIEKRKLNTPLKISSLLNPVYVPFSKTRNTGGQLSTTLLQTKPQEVEIKQLPINVNKPIKLQDDSEICAVPVAVFETGLTAVQLKARANKEECKKQETATQQTIPHNMDLPKTIAVEKATLLGSLDIKEVSSSSQSPSPTKTNNLEQSNSSIIERVDQHSRRRELINQLEKSIASGNERAAAEAAVKLAQLRLSCSVLSFSSQIVAEASTPGPKPAEEKIIEAHINENKNLKESEHLKIISALPTPNVSSYDFMNRLSSQTVSQTKKADKPKLATSNDVKTSSTAKILEIKASTSKQATNTENALNMVSVVVWVEDREAARGPVNLRIQRGGVMGDLRREAETSLGIAARLQRWIVGRTLCNDDNTQLVTLAGPDYSAPFYLCLVESDTASSARSENAQSNKVPAEKLQPDDNAGKVYTELVKLEQLALVPNAETFECDVCMEETVPGSGMVLRECVHTFCRNCLSDVIRHSEEPIVSCPATSCPGVLQEREIRALVSPEEYERWLARSLAAAESGTRNAFHCRTRDCTGWALCEPGVRQFPCPVCKRTNCVPCQVIHEGDTCEQHRHKLQSAAKTADHETDESTLALLDTLINKGEALECPECSAIITKKWGCDWVKCSACKTEICWVTRGRRWGPGGRGDTSGGCRCGVDGRRCHPTCGYCH